MHVARLVGMAAALTVWTAGLRPARAHDPLTPEQLQQLLAEEDYADRVARLRYLRQYELGSGLHQRAVYRVRRAAMEASGQTEVEIERDLLAGDRAFPYQMQPELRASGKVKTLTVLIDFKDFRAGTVLPGIGAPEVAANLYGEGTPIAQARHAPFESLRAYYRRASEGLVDVDGSVLGWHTFAEERHTYGPAKAPLGPARDVNQQYLDNAALFRMAKEALSALDATTDFAPYDNDRDGDIDLLTILYAGPPGEWASFWWAYRWLFFIEEAATTRFDNKRLRQFVFSFVETREDGTDYDPRTMLHEMGHAFGLADYYDYTPTPPAKPNAPPPVPDGPDGGVGGLDMMDGNQGNHGAFSRWLVDWIDPLGVGRTPPVEYTLVASGAPGTGAKAIAVFPDLVDATAPVGEFFLLEYRSPVGNDGGEFGVPQAGLVIWHVDADLDVRRTKFRYDNSRTPRLLLRMVRASTPHDFAPFGVSGRATAADLFGDGDRFTMQTLPSSRRYGAVDTGVVVEVLSHDTHTMRVRVGVEVPPGPQPSGPRPEGDAAVLEQLLSPAEGVGLGAQKLDRFDEELGTSDAAQVARLWARLEAAAPDPRAGHGHAILRRMVLAHWAAKDGAGACEALLAGKATGTRLVSELPLVLEAWGTHDPEAAARWYAQAGDERRLPHGVTAGGEFARVVVQALSSQRGEPPLRFVERLESAGDVAGAIAGLRAYYATTGAPPEAVLSQLRDLRRNAAAAEALFVTQEASEAALLRIRDPEERARVREALTWPLLR